MNTYQIENLVYAMQIIGALLLLGIVIYIASAINIKD